MTTRRTSKRRPLLALGLVLAVAAVAAVLGGRSVLPRGSDSVLAPETASAAAPPAAGGADRAQPHLVLYRVEGGTRTPVARIALAGRGHDRLRFAPQQLDAGTYAFQVELGAKPATSPAPPRRGQPRRSPDRTVVRLSAIPLLARAPLPGAAQLGVQRDVETPVLPLDVRVTDPEGIEPQIAAAINRERVARGLRPLRTSPLLARAADAHARALALAGEFEHEWPDGRAFGDWIPRYYPLRSYRLWSAGENLLWTPGTVTPNEAVRLWLASPTHRRNMLDPAWREIGVGVVHADEAGGAFLAQSVDIAATEFGRRT